MIMTGVAGTCRGRWSVQLFHGCALGPGVGGVGVRRRLAGCGRWCGPTAAARWRRARTLRAHQLDRRRARTGTINALHSATRPLAECGNSLLKTTSSVWSSMTECGVAVAFVERLLLSLEPGKLALEIRDQHVGQIVAETPPDHESQGCEVLAVLRKGVGGHLPTTFAHRVGDVED